MRKKSSMPDDLALLAPIDFPTPTILCAYKGCDDEAVRLVTCANKHCPSKWTTVCSKHLHNALTSLTAVVCGHCGRVSALRDFLIARPL